MAVNVAVVLPDPTVTDAGTVNGATLLDSVTVAPLVFDTVTVHVELAPEPRLVGLHVSPLITVAVAKEIVAVCALPFSVAVMVAAWSLGIVPAVAVNVAVVLPDPTVTDAGTVSAPALLDSVTVVPPVFDTVTVHVELAPEPRLVGLHVSPLTTAAVASAMFAVAVPPFNVAVTVAV
jgi:post-segregation antitoxin (ccd killing protein)